MPTGRRSSRLACLTSNDTDRDTLADDWERYYFGSLERTAIEDTDQDGTTNGFEAVAGTNPADPLSTLRLRIDPASVVAGTPTLLWPAVPGRTYALSFADTLTADAWQNAPGSPVKTSLGFSWQDPTTPPAPQRYYLLRVSR